MSQKCVFCIAASESQASQIANELRKVGFSNNDITALLPDKTGNKDFAHELHSKAAEGAMTGGMVGGVSLGLVGWMAGLGLVAVPGAAPLIAAGPILAAFSGVAAGILLGGSAGAIVGKTRPEYVARRYEGKIGVGNILISIHCDAEKSVRVVKKIFRSAGATDIACASEVAVPNVMRRKEAV